MQSLLVAVLPAETPTTLGGRDLATTIAAPEDTAIRCAHNTRVAKLSRVPSNGGEAATNQGSFPPFLRFPSPLPYTTAKTDQQHPFLLTFQFGL